MEALSGGLGSLRRRQPPPAAKPPAVPAPEEVEEEARPDAVKPSQLRTARAMVRDALSELDRAPVRQSLGDLSEYTRREEPPKSPRAQELDGLIAEARQAAAPGPEPEPQPPAVVVVAAAEAESAAAAQQPKKTRLETISPYDSSPSQSPREGESSRRSAAAGEAGVHKSLVGQLRWENAPSPQGSRNSMHCVEVGEEEGDDDSSTTE